MKRYKASRSWNGTEVTVDGNPLNLRLELRNHSPSGFEWGYGGSGPAQLAIALLADCLGDHEQAVQLHQEFKRTVMANLDCCGWTMTSQAIRARVRRLAPVGRRS